jgi:hypothetical protein
LSLELDNHTNKKEILTLKKAQYENNKITLEDWQRAKKITKTETWLFWQRKPISKMKQFEIKVKKLLLQERD